MFKQSKLRKQTVWNLAIVTTVVVVVLAAALVVALPASAHDGPDQGAEWLMVDWMMGAFVAFGGSGFIIFLIALKRGWMRNNEQAKYYVLTLDEPDYYTPGWAREESEDKHAP